MSATLPSHITSEAEHFSENTANIFDQPLSISPLIVPIQEKVSHPIIPIESELTITEKNTTSEQVVMKNKIIQKNNVDKILNLTSNEPATTSNKRKQQPLKLNKEKVKISKKNSPEHSDPIISALTSLTKSNDELLRLEENIFQKITASLKIAGFPPDDYFYLQLINTIAAFISPNSDLDRLIQLRLAEIVLYFSKSHEGEFFENKQQIIDNALRINSVYNDFFPSAERLKLEILHEKFQAKDGLKSLFLSEIKTYYFKKKIELPNNESRKFFLNELQANLVSSIQKVHTAVSAVETAAITESTIKIISNCISDLPIDSEHQLFEKLLQAIRAFFISDTQSQQRRLAENNISIKPSDLSSQDLNYYSAPGVQPIQNNLSGIPKLYFFKPQSITLTKEVFLTKIKEHLIGLKTDYVTSNNTYSDICRRLTQLIITQTAQHTEDQKPIWRPYAS